MDNSTALVVMVVIVLLLWIGPVGLIWSFNTLFNAGIAYSFKNWLAALLMMFLLQGSNVKSK
jgi:hypothetical protein